MLREFNIRDECGHDVSSGENEVDANATMGSIRREFVSLSFDCGTLCVSFHEDR